MYNNKVFEKTNKSTNKLFANIYFVYIILTNKIKFYLWNKYQNISFINSLIVI